MPLSCAIFDLDGVVVDTVPIHFRAWKRMFEEYGKTFTFDDYKAKVDGIPRIDGARAILTDLSPTRLEEAADKKQRYFLEYLEEEKIPVYDSTVRLIDNLLAAKIKVAVISSSKNCRPILTRIGLIDRLDDVVTGKDITKGKPDPQIFLMAAEHLKQPPSQCIVFEDAVLGVEAARRAQMKCVGIDRYNDPQRLKLADRIVADAGEITVAELKALFGE